MFQMACWVKYGVYRYVVRYGWIDVSLPLLPLECDRGCTPVFEYEQFDTMPYCNICDTLLTPHFVKLCHGFVVALCYDDWCDDERLE